MANSDVPVIVDVLRCSGCGRCVAACPKRLLTLDAHGTRKSAHLRFPDGCDRCGCCVEACPLRAIRLT